MRSIYMVLLIVFLVTALAACQPNEGTALVPETGATESVEPASTPEDVLSPTSLPEGNITSSADSSPSPEATDMTPALPPDESAQKMVTLVTEHLAQRLSVPADQIVLADVKPVVWRDAGLGCPKPGVDYIQMETPGYTIVLEAGSETYSYHTDESRRFVLCNT
jgi:hypothetical protein